MEIRKTTLSTWYLSMWIMMPQPLIQVVPLLPPVIVTELFMQDYIGELLLLQQHPLPEEVKFKIPGGNLSKSDSRR